MYVSTVKVFLTFMLGFVESASVKAVSKCLPLHLLQKGLSLISILIQV